LSVNAIPVDNDGAVHGELVDVASEQVIAEVVVSSSSDRRLAVERRSQVT